MDFAQMRRFTEMSKQIEALEARVKVLEGSPPQATKTDRAALIQAYTERFGKPPHRNTPTMALERMLSQ